MEIIETVKDKSLDTLRRAINSGPGSKVFNEEIELRDNEIRDYYDRIRPYLSKSQREAKDEEITHLMKSIDWINRLSNEELAFIKEDLEMIGNSIPSNIDKRYGARISLGVAMYMLNMVGSNATELASIPYLFTQVSKIEDPKLQAITYTSLAVFTFISNTFFGVPSIAGATRTLLFNIPEELINRVFSKYILKDPYPEYNIKAALLDKKNLILSLEGAGLFVLPILELLRALKLNISGLSIEYILHLNKLKTSLEGDIY